MSTPIDREKLLPLSYLGRRTGDVVRDGRRADGVRIKVTTDELGNTVTEHAVKGDRVDVQINAPHLRIKAGTTTEEIR